MSCTEILLVYFVNNWCVRCTWCNIDNIGLREKNQQGTNTEDRIEKKRFTKTETRGISVYHEECKINLTENDSRSRFSAHKNQQKHIGEEKSTIKESQNNPPVPSITPLFNLLALRNQFWWCVCFFLLYFFIYIV